MQKRSFSIIVLLFLAITASSQVPRGFSPSDLAAMKDISDARISPDGSQVVYVVSENSPDLSRRVSRLWIVPVKGGEPKQLTIGEESESTPRWSPDGRMIAFYSNRDGRDGIWVVQAAGGEPALVTHVYRTNFYMKSAGESFTWSPDSKRIAFLSSIEVLNEARQAPAVANQNAVGLPPQMLRPLTREEIDNLPVEIREMIFRAQGQAMGRRPASANENLLSVLPDDPRVITRLQYKSRTEFSDNLQSHIFVIDLDRTRLRQVTTGIHYEHSIDWSPKGDEIVFVSNRQLDPDKVNNTDLFTVNVNTFAIRQLTKSEGCEWLPAWSPDGSRIAFIGTKRATTTIDSVAEDSQAYVISATGGHAIEMSHSKDRRVFAVKWSPDGDTLYYQLGDRGRMAVWASSLTPQSVQGDPKAVLELRAQVSALSVGGNSAAFILSNPTQPAEVYVSGIGAKKISEDSIHRLSDVNKSLPENIKFSDMQEFNFRNDGFEIQGWVVLPPNADRNGKYPAILSIHGGPHGMYSYGFNPTVQMLAAGGYAVILINPRGSSGYGQKFSDGCLNDWGGGDYRDLMKGVDEALARFPQLDANRLGVTGGSYGGYMTNWVITQTDRFRAAVASASLSNLISFYSTSLYQDLIHAEFNGYPWDNYEILWERSPLKHIKNVKTPLMLIHGEQDNDVHITQAEEMFTAAKMRGIETVLVRYPREGHGIREIRHRQDMTARMILWFDRLLKK